jgi:hypothetical protein
MDNLSDHLVEPPPLPAALYSVLVFPFVGIS